ncbi:uncharacterized protein LOC132201648 [Neocloeon triangulifer]|uniref:uncharacterized protein LOC132201648 n=1 Tax=Neocloeon triangulifer TaxID=2078957 RepID=UPI00286F41B1|nr:uncharacterized protein LOC132201648 [Neocloeon triangulifer]
MRVLTILFFLSAAFFANAAVNPASELDWNSLGEILNIDGAKLEKLQMMQKHFADSRASDLPDVGLPTPDMIKRQGYPAEIHYVTTEDGYILQMHRIPNPGKPVIFLQHGLLCSSADWVMMGPDLGLAYLLFHRGYDIWMGNCRGNTYSRNHTTLNPDTDSEFWNFSWHEMGHFDITAEIDYVLGQTGETQLVYMGHSMGTTQFFVMVSERPEYNAKIRQMHALAPVAFMGGVRSPLALLAPFVDQLEWVLNMFGVDEFFPSTEFLEFIGASLCRDGAFTQAICSNVLFLLCGFDSKQLNETTMPIIISHTPAGASSKTVLHYTQEINSDKFRQYDYGYFDNMDHYGQHAPPQYDLSKITANIYLHYSENDWMSHPNDVTQLYNQLASCQGKFRVPLPEFNHLDFLWAIDVKTLLYNTIFSLLNRITSSRRTLVLTSWPIFLKTLRSLLNSMSAKLTRTKADVKKDNLAKKSKCLMAPLTSVVICLLVSFLSPVTFGLSVMDRKHRQILAAFNISQNRTTGQTPVVNFLPDSNPRKKPGVKQNKRYPGRRRCGPDTPNELQTTVDLPLPLKSIRISGDMIFLDDVCYYDIDMDLTTPQMIRRRGYPAESHSVKTEDGYILGLHRIPNPGKPPILLQHGIVSSSAVWVLTGPEKSLAYILWREGYDVWMGNYRGTEYSRAHISITSSDEKFWDFSCHELGIYDLPAFIDYILKWTFSTELDYIGHSLGTTGFFIMTAERPEYNNKIRQMHAFAPVAFVWKLMNPPLQALQLLSKLNATEVELNTNLLTTLGQRMCAGDEFFPQALCSSLLFLFIGFEPGHFDKKLIPLIVAHTQSGTPMKILRHYGQIYTSGKFAQYNYGIRENMERYKSPFPPNYDLRKITAPTYLYYGNNDRIVPIADVIKLSNLLPNDYLYKVPDAKFNHLDFLWSDDVQELLYDRLLDNLSHRPKRHRRLNRRRTLKDIYVNYSN